MYVTLHALSSFHGLQTILHTVLILQVVNVARASAEQAHCGEVQGLARTVDRGYRRIQSFPTALNLERRNEPYLDPADRGDHASNQMEIEAGEAMAEATAMCVVIDGNCDTGSGVLERRKDGLRVARPLRGWWEVKKLSKMHASSRSLLETAFCFAVVATNYLRILAVSTYFSINLFAELMVLDRSRRN